MSAPRQCRWAALVCTSLILTACAVMRIDVDVYKGPLANEEHVQVHQFAAMAVGARPLLTQLRDSLQWKNTELNDVRLAEEWYRTGYIARPMAWVETATVGYWSEIAWKVQAGRVNAVLSLYQPVD